MSAVAEVLLVVPVLEPAGAERVVAELAKRLPSHGFSTSVLCMENEDAPIGVELKQAGVRVDGLRLSRRQTFACGRGIAARVREMNPATPMIVCAHLFHANFAARQVPRMLAPALRKNVRIVTTIHVAERRFRPWQFWFDRITAQRGACEVCISKSVAEFHRRKTGLPESFFRVVENGIDLSRYSSLPPSSRASNMPRVVSVGRLNKQKDFPTLMRAWKIVESARPDATLEIAGAGPEEASLKRMRDELDLKRIQFIGFCSDVPTLLTDADLYVQSSAWEGMPLTVLEAMASGLPVIASAVDSLPEIIDDGRSGILFQRGNSDALAQYILALLGDPAHAKALGAAAREVALTRFSAERMAADYARVFCEVLALPEKSA